MSLATIPGTWARFSPQRIALHHAGLDTTYQRLANRVERAAARLEGEWQVAAGDRVAYLGANTPEELILLFALARLGAILLPLNTRLSPAEWRAILADCGARHLVSEASHAAQGAELGRALGLAVHDCEELIAEPCAHRPAARDWLGTTPVLLVYTSGSSGAPKGVVHSQDGILWNASASIAAHDLTSTDHVLTSLPLFHVGALCIQTLPALMAGACVTLHGRFDATHWLEAVALRRPTLSLMVPATLAAVIEHDEWQGTDLSSLRLLMAGSQIIPRALLQAFHRRGIPVGQVYGSTETGPVSIVLRGDRAIEKEGMAGWPALFSDIRLIGGAGGEVAAGEVGEIQVRGRNLMTGYWGERPGAALDQGWFRSGDLGRRDSDGCIEVVGRSSERIISGGENIYPAEIENLILEHPAVAEVAVVGVSDVRWGETPVAAIVLRSGVSASAEDILASLDGRLAGFKRPRHIRFVPSLPRTALGKVRKTELADSLSGETSAAGHAPRPDRQHDPLR